MSNKITIRQLVDKFGKPIAPYTPAAAVYLPDGTNVETQIGGMDIGAIEEQQAAALQEIHDVTTIAIARIDAEQAEDRANIARLQNDVERLDKNLMKLKIDFTITPNESMTTCDITFAVHDFDGSIPTLTSMVITKSVNNGPAKVIFTGTEYTGTVTNSIEGGVEVYTFTAKTATKTETVQTPLYLCFYGASPVEDVAEADVCNFSRILTNSGSFRADLGTERGDYIWLLMPSVLGDTEVKQQGIEVTTNDPYMVEVDTYGYFRAYRTVNKLADATWRLSVN